MDTRVLWLGVGLILSTAGCVTGDEATSADGVDGQDAAAVSPHARQVSEEEVASQQASAPVAAKEAASTPPTAPQVTGSEKRPKLPAPPTLKERPTPAVAAKAKAPAVMTRGKSPRLVTAGVLNIRSRPSTSAAVVGKLTKGTVLPVIIKGQWAQLADNQWVLAKYLSAVSH